jgi:hypothetical protein
MLGNPNPQAVWKHLTTFSNGYFAACSWGHCPNTAIHCM